MFSKYILVITEYINTFYQIIVQRIHNLHHDIHLLN